MDWLNHDAGGCGPDATRQLLHQLEQGRQSQMGLPPRAALGAGPDAALMVRSRSMRSEEMETAFYQAAKKEMEQGAASDAAFTWTSEFQQWALPLRDWTKAFLQQTTGARARASAEQAWALQFEALERAQVHQEQPAQESALDWQRIWAQSEAAIAQGLDSTGDRKMESEEAKHHLDGLADLSLDAQLVAFEESWALGASHALHDADDAPGASRRLAHLLHDYVFEIENVYLTHPEPYQEGLRLRQMGSLTEAALAFEAALQRQAQALSEWEERREEETSHAWLSLAEIQAENEKEAAAIAAYHQCLRHAPRHPKALMGLAVSYTNEGAEAKVLGLLRDWLDSQYPAFRSLSGPDQGFALHQEAAGSLFERRAAVIEAYLNVIRATLTSPDPELQVGLGILFYNASQYDKAIDCFHAALQCRPEDYLLWNRMGATLANSHRSEEAIAKYERALALKPSFVRARHNLGVSCMNIGCYEEAAAHLLQALSCCHSARSLNISTNLWETLRRDFVYMNRQDLALLCDEQRLEPILQAMKPLLAWMGAPTPLAE